MNAGISMKNILFLVTLFCTSSAAFADIADQVVVVRPSLSDEAIQTYENLALWMESLGEDSLAGYFRGKAEGGFGSGALILGRNDEVLVVTNYHVVAQSDTVAIELKGRKSEGELLEDCRVIVADPYRDLAIIHVPELNAEEIELLRFSEIMPKDGMNVISAGYPGLGGDPSWQFGSGTITNQEAVIEDLNVPEVDYVIQHSAIIDPGSSGGPLLLETEESGRYEIVGMNTWSVSNRDNTYFAIPGHEVIELLDEIYASPTGDHTDSERLEKLCVMYADILENKKQELADPQISSRILSTSLISSIGFEALTDYLDSIQDSGNDEFDEGMFFEHTFDSLGAAILLKSSGFAGKNPVSWSTEQTESGMIAFFRYGDAEEMITLAVENGRWVIAYFGISGEEGVGSESPNAALFSMIGMEEYLARDTDSVTEDRKPSETEESGNDGIKEQVRAGLTGFSISAYGGLSGEYMYANEWDMYADVNDSFPFGGIGFLYTLNPYLGFQLGIEYQYMKNWIDYYDTSPTLSEPNLSLNRIRAPLMARVQLPLISQGGSVFLFYLATGVQISLNFGDGISQANGDIAPEPFSFTIPVRLGFEFAPAIWNDVFMIFVEGGVSVLGEKMYTGDVFDDGDGDWNEIFAVYNDSLQYRFGFRFLL